MTMVKTHYRVRFAHGRVGDFWADDGMELSKQIFEYLLPQMRNLDRVEVDLHLMEGRIDPALGVFKIEIA